MLTEKEDYILPAPILPQRNNENFIDVSDIENDYIIIYIPSYKDEYNGDRIIACIGDSISSEPFFITNNKPYRITITIPFTQIPDGTYNVFYTITDVLGNESQSICTPVSIIHSPGTQKNICVMGARGIYGNKSGCSFIGFFSRSTQISALDNNSREFISVDWRYDGDIDWICSEYFHDIDPSRKLHVRSGKEHIIINPINIFEGADNSAAMLNDGSIVTWRDNINLISRGSTAFIGVTCYLNDSYVFLRENGDVFLSGIITGEINNLRISRLINNDNLTVGLKEDGLIAWGNTSSDSSIPLGISSLIDIIQVVSTGNFFIALRKNGSIVAWGDYIILPEIIRNMENISQVVGNNFGIAVLCPDGSVVTWWKDSNRTDINKRYDVVRLFNNLNNFAALCSNGNIFEWGESTTPLFEVNAIDIIGTYNASKYYHGFIALLSDHSIFTWAEGIQIPDIIRNRKDIVQIAYATLDICHPIFSILCTSGEVFNINIDSGELVYNNEIKNAKAIYSNIMSITVLTGDNNVVIWGSEDAVGEGGDLESYLNKNISYELMHYFE